LPSLAAIWFAPCRVIVATTMQRCSRKRDIGLLFPHGDPDQWLVASSPVRAAQPGQFPVSGWPSGWAPAPAGATPFLRARPAGIPVGVTRRGGSCQCHGAAFRRTTGTVANRRRQFRSRRPGTLMVAPPVAPAVSVASWRRARRRSDVSLA
jgi:hypothetical protein